MQAVHLYLEGMSQRTIGHLLGVVHQSVANWVAAHAATIPADPTDHPPPDEGGDGTVEVDELETFVEGKSRPISVTIADTLPAVGRYCTDGAAVYAEVVWPEDAWHGVLIAKEETYTIEGINADLRTYLGRLKRRSRCFSRSAAKLAEAVRLFVWHYNRGQRAINANPRLRHVLPLLF